MSEEIAISGFGPVDAMDCLQEKSARVRQRGWLLNGRPSESIGGGDDQRKSLFTRKVDISLATLFPSFSTQSAQTAPPCAQTAAMLFWALLAGGQIAMRKVDGWRSLAEKPIDQIIDVAA